MPINDARRIAAFGWEVLASVKHLDEEAAKAQCAAAETVCDDADVARAIETLKRIAGKRGVAVEELLAAYE